MVFESADGTFSSIGTVFFRWDSLILDLVLHEGILEVLRAFVVQDVEVGGMSLMHKDLVGLFPGIANTGGFAIGNSNSMDGVRVLVVKDKDVVVAAAGGNGEATGLIRVRLQVLLIVKEHDGDSVRAGFKGWGNVVIIVDGDDLGGSRQWGSRGAKIFCLLILMAETSGNRFWKMLGDQLGGETWKSGQVSATNGS